MIANVRGVGAGPSALSSSANTAACVSAIVLAYRLKPGPEHATPGFCVTSNWQRFPNGTGYGTIPKRWVWLTHRYEAAGDGRGNGDAKDRIGAAGDGCHHERPRTAAEDDRGRTAGSA